MKTRNLFSKAALILLAVISLAAVTGCNNITSGLSEKNGKVKVSISVGNQIRTLVPEPEAEAATDYKLYVSSENEPEELAASWDTYSQMVQDELEFDPGTYSFRLEAKCGYFIFSGTTQKELSLEGDNTLNFKLAMDTAASIAFYGENTPDLTGLPGTLDLMIYYKDNGEDIETDIIVTDIMSILLDSGPVDLKTSQDIPPVDGTGEYEGYKCIHYINHEISYGQYLLFINCSGNNKTAFREDDIVLVLPELTTKGTFVIDGYVPVHKVTYDFQLPGIDDYEEEYLIGDREMDVLDIEDDDLSAYDFSNYIFDGWYETPECDGEEVTLIDTFEHNVDFTLYAKWEETNTEDSSDHITLRKCEQGIEVTVNKLEGEGGWTNASFTEDTTGIGIMLKEGNSIPAEGNSVTYIYPFTEEGTLYSFTFRATSENDGTFEEHLTCRGGDGDKLSITLEDSFNNAQVKLADSSWGEGKYSNYKLTEDICSIFPVIDQNYFDNIDFDISISYGDQPDCFTWLTGKTITYFDSASGLSNLEEYEDWLAGDICVDDTSQAYQTLSLHKLWAIEAVMSVKFADYDATFILKTLTDQKDFAVNSEWFSFNTLVQNDDGTFTLHVPDASSTNIAQVSFIDASGRVRFVALTQNNTDDEITLSIPSVFEEDEDYSVQAIYGNASMQIINNGNFYGKAKYAGTLTAEINQYLTGQIVSRVTVPANADKIRAQFNVINKGGFKVIDRDFTEEEKEQGYVDFLYDSIMHENEEFSLVVEFTCNEGNLIYNSFYYDTAEEEGMKAGWINEMGDGTFIVHMPLTDGVIKIRNVFEDTNENIIEPIWDFDVTAEDIEEGYKECRVHSPLNAGDEYSIKSMLITVENGDGVSYAYEDVFTGTAEYNGDFIQTVTENSNGTFTIHAPVTEDVTKLVVTSSTGSSTSDFIIDLDKAGPENTIVVTNADRIAGYKDITIGSYFRSNTDYVIRVEYIDETQNNKKVYRLCSSGTTEYGGIAYPKCLEQSDGTFTVTTPIWKDDTKVKITSKSQNEIKGPVFTYNVVQEDKDNGYKIITGVPSEFSRNEEYAITVKGTSESSQEISFTGYAQYEGAAVSTMTQTEAGTLVFKTYVTDDVDTLNLVCLSDDFTDYYSAFTGITVDETDKANGYKEVTVNSVFQISDYVIKFKVAAYSNSSTTALYSLNYSEQPAYNGAASRNWKENSDGTFTIRYPLMRGVTKLVVRTLKSNYSQLGREVEISVDESDHANLCKEFNLNSPYEENMNYKIEITPYKNSTAVGDEDYLGGKTNRLGNISNKCVFNSNGTITVGYLEESDAPFSNKEGVEITVYGNNRLKYPIREFVLSETQKQSCYIEFTFNSPLNAGMSYSIRTKLYKDENNFTYLGDFEGSSVLYEGAISSQIQESDDGKFTIREALTSNTVRMVVECYDTSTSNVIAEETFNAASGDYDNEYMTLVFDSPYSSGSSYRIKVTKWTQDISLIDEVYTGTTQYTGASYSE